MDFFWKTLRNELFWTLLEELNPFYYVFKNSTLFEKNKTPRIEPFFNTTQRFCSLNMTQNFFFEYDSKNWTFLSIWHKGLNLFVECDSNNSTFFQCDSNIFFRKNDSKLFTLFCKYDLRIELFLKNYDSRNWTLPINMTHRMEPFFSIWLKELNPFQNITQRTEPFSTYDSKNWTFFSIELFQYDSKDLIFSICFEDLNPFLIWPKELTFFGKMTQIFEPFFNMTQRIDFFHIIPIIEPYLKIGSQNWFFKSYSKNRFFFQKKLIELKELNLSWLSLKRLNFFCWKYDSKNWTFFFSQFDSKNCSFFFFHDSNTWTFFTWLKELNFLFLRDSNTWTFFWIYFSKKWTLFFSGLKVFSSKKNSQNSFFFESDPQNWFLWIEPFNFLNMTQRIEPFNFLNMTQRFEPFFSKYHSKNWFFYKTQRIELFDEYDSKN